MQQISELNVDTTINELLNSELGFLLIKKDTKNEDVYEVVCDNVQFLEPKQNSQPSQYSQSQQTYPYEQPPVQTYYQQQSITAEAEKSVPWDVADTLDISTDDLPF